MSSPQAGGGRKFDLAQGVDATMLAETVHPKHPVTVINDGTVRVFLAGDSNASANTGIPLEAGTAQKWDSAGQLWAFVDPSAGSNGHVRITSASSDYQPSPYDVAAFAAGVTAAQLLASGVPNKLLEDIVFTGTIADGDSSDPIDVSDYASAVVTLAVPFSDSILVTQHDDDGNITDEDLVFAGNASAPMRIALTGTTLTLTNRTSFPAATATLTVEASNRPALQRLDVRRQVAAGNYYDSGPAATFTAGSPLNLGGLNTETQLQGAAFFSAMISGTTVTGRFEMIINGDNTRPVVLLDTQQMITETGSGGYRFGSAHIAVPAAPFSIRFHCFGTGGSAQATAAIILS